MSAPRSQGELGFTPRSSKAPGNPAANYEQFFVPAIGAPLAHELVQAARLQPGERVLDVACGTGVLARLAAGAVGRSGRVNGLDINPDMLAVAGAITPEDANVEWHEASAESMPFPDASFDVVLCQLGLQFVEDRPAAVREMKRVLRPGGRIVMNVAGDAGFLFATADAAFERHLGPRAAGFVRTVFSMGDPDELRSLMNDAGFQDVSVTAETKTLRLPPPREFLWQYVSSTPLAAAAAQADRERLEALEREVVDRWQTVSDGHGMRYEQEIVIATARG